MKEHLQPKEHLRALICSIHGLVIFEGTDGEPVMAMTKQNLDYGVARHKLEYPWDECKFSSVKVPGFVEE